MRYLLLAVLMLLPVTVYAEIISVDRNSESDMASYNFYMCESPCTIAKIPAQLIGTSPQPIVSVRPSLTYSLASKQGLVAVTAVDTTGNESGLSVAVPFDKKAPSAPVNPTVQ